MNRPLERLGRGLILTAGLGYPFAVYFLMGRVPLWTFFALGLVIGAVRLFYRRGQSDFRYGAVAFGLGACALIALFWVDSLGAVQAYPVVVSLSFAAVFGYSLWRPPTVIERIARRLQPDLPAAGVRYARVVTWVWFGFLIVNAAICIATILWASVAVWALWSGLLSYLVMGVLFAGEYAVRRIVRR